MKYDLVIRGGTVADGSGAETFEADVAIRNGVIVEVGKTLGAGVEEIDARGRLVTPGFVDIHTHYDGQVTWDNRLSPSSGHGVTSVLMGNCGVGFAPCLPSQRDIMVEVMEGVEDIPGIVMAEGLPWNWETFPQYLDAIEARHTDVDFAAQIPHCALRVYVMGQRGVDREPANSDDIKRMAAIVREAVAAGAFGFSTSRVAGHRTAGGEVIPSTTASEDELTAIALSMKDVGAGIFQTAAEFDLSNGFSAEFAMLKRLGKISGRPVHFPLLEYRENPEGWKQVVNACAEARADGVEMYGQVCARPVGLLYGLELSCHPFIGCASYRAIAKMPLAERVAALRDPALKARILSETPEHLDKRVLALSRSVEDMYRMGEPPDYAPPASERLENIAKRTDTTALSVAYDIMLEHDGRGIIYHPARNYFFQSLDAVMDMLQRPETVVGLGDGGAHLGRICDGSISTFMLTYWTRDRVGKRLSVPWVVKALTHDTARIGGFGDRGLLKPGYKADVNVIDYDKLTLHAPFAAHDLPAGGCRLFQKADGYTATILSGAITYRDGTPTGALPGRLVRHQRSAPRGM